MNFYKSSFAAVGLFLMVAVTGCGIITPHADCDQVAQRQRSGATDTEIAQSSGYTLAEVQSCSQTGPAGGRETANNYQDQPQLPAIPMSVPAGAIGGAAR
jgi:hypothetical protein